MRVFILVRRCAWTVAMIIGSATSLAGQGVEAGGSVGYLWDTTDDFIAVSGEARIDLSDSKGAVVPRLTYYIESGITRIQVDGNVYRDLPLEGESRAVPYAGVGIAIERISFDGGESPGIGGGSETNVGLNLIAGARRNSDSAVTPFAQFQYTAIRDQANSFVLSVGGLWRVSGA